MHSGLAMVATESVVCSSLLPIHKTLTLFLKQMKLGSVLMLAAHFVV